MNRRTCFAKLIVVFFAATLLVNGASAKDFTQQYKEFKEHCHRWASATALTEYNRAMNEARLLHGDFELGKRSAKEVIKELTRQGYVNKRLYFEYDWDPFSRKGYSFSSSRYSNLSLDLAGYFKKKYRGAFLKKGLVDSSFRVRWYVLQCLARRTDVTPLKIVLKAYVFEKREQLLQHYIRLLVSDRFVKAALRYNKYPKSVIKRITLSINAARTMYEKAQVLFLAVMFTKERPKFEIPVVIHQMEQGYSVAYLVKLFQSYPEKWVEEFTIPFKEGYGDQHAKLLTIFSHFADNPTCLAALAHALKNRSTGHFSDLRAKIIKTWQEITGIEFKGDISPYLAWYEEKKKRGRKMVKKVTMTGTAQNAKGGAVLLVEGAPYYIPQLDEWPDELLGQEVEVTAIKKVEQFLPEVTVDKDGAISQGALGQQTTLRQATWKKVP